jgi:hypothetical protein
MGVEGQWFMQPGDIPAPFVFVVDLDSEGNAVWSCNPSLVSRYRFTGKHLVIGWGEEQRIVLNVPDPDADMLGGNIEKRFVYEEDDLYEDEAQGGANDNARISVGDFGLYIDAAAFMRFPHMLEVVDLDGPVAATAADFFDADPGAALARASLLI